MEQVNNPQILIIDDEIDVRERLANILKRRGYPVLTAQDGWEGLEIAEKEAVHIIICDINMPRIDGLGFLSRIRSVNLKAEVIIVTGDPSIENCVKSMENNAFSYLVKPLSAEAIVESIAKAEKRIIEKEEILKNSLGHFRNKTFPLSMPNSSDLK